jgi:nitric oxide reductase NorE protein
MRASGMTGENRPANAAPRRVPGDGSIWVFVFGDMVIFSAYFSAYMIDRGHNRPLFVESQRLLNQNIGVINTLLLLTSSLFVALSVQAAKAADFRLALRFLTGGAAFGIGFVILKSCEWYLKLSHGLSLGTNAFFMHYYMMTGLHFFHVLLGLVILFVVYRELKAQTPRPHVLEIGATYWHMVDFLWILIFALLYLMR